MSNEGFDVDEYEKGTEYAPLPLEGLIYYLKHGREIEFSYQGQSYFIGHSREGRTVWIDQTAVSKTFEKNFEEHLSEIFLKSKSLADIFRDEEGVIESIL
ncbi:hypothetical protein [Marinilactibacillus sp. Marseille-P9653]|uniref:hypothetical protein n=1 Tax=Marinilactibacillus sp. Marseille-P9653 TaxID=2866583 RepID=UPI001CE471FB|nr:hypothetical protein [Marinilactibacillus sp. Marseille-P9653]